VVADPGSDALVEVALAGDDDGSAGEAQRIAATAREALLGTVLPELERLSSVGDGSGAGSSPADSPWLSRVRGVDEDVAARPAGPIFHLEGGYQGDHALPDGQPLHGPWLGVTLTPTPMLRPALSVGWLGLGRGEIEAGEVVSHRLTASLSLRLVFTMGLASVSLAPVGRLDVVFSEADPTAAHEPTESGTELELHAGGTTTWRLPLPARDLDAVVGVGVLASLLSSDVEVDGETAVRASSLRITWHVGVCWGAF
jgi:hypothetical protein